MPDDSAQQPVLVIMGVACCGKSTVAALLCVFHVRNLGRRFVRAIAVTR